MTKAIGLFDQKSKGPKKDENNRPKVEKDLIIIQKNCKNKSQKALRTQAQ